MADDQTNPIVRVVRVPASELRRIFNEQNLYAQTKSGLLRSVLMKERHPSPQPASEPSCTRSQVISNLESEGNAIARVHQYLRPDGAIGGSGKPDPKRVLYMGAIYLPE